jgi:hypothetical protein
MAIEADEIAHERSRRIVGEGVRSEGNRDKQAECESHA